MILTTLLSAILQILDMLINAYIWMIIIGTLALLIQPSLSHPIIDFFNRLTIPLYRKIRKVIPTTYGNIDFAPFIVIILLKFIDLFLIRIAFESLYAH